MVRVAVLVAVVTDGPVATIHPVLPVTGAAVPQGPQLAERLLRERVEGSFFGTSKLNKYELKVSLLVM